MKVCLVTRYFESTMKDGVGIGRVSGEIYRGLAKQKIEVKPISTEGSGLYSYFLYSFLEIPLRLPRDYDVFHALTPVESIWLPKDRSIVTFHDLFQLTNPDRIGSGLERRSWEKWIGVKYFEFACKAAATCKRVVCVSEKTKGEVMRLLKVPEEKIRVIRSGISKSLEPEPRSDSVFTVGYLGMLDRRKRVDLLIRAFKESRADGRLLIGGRGLQEDYLKELAKGDDRIKFLGYIPETKVNSFLNSLDLFVFPTWLEGYGLPAVEAMTCKKPVAVFNDAIIPDEIKSRCLRAIDVKELTYLFDHLNLAREIVKHSIDLEDNYRFAKEHDWDKAMEEYLQVYEEVIRD